MRICGRRIPAVVVAACALLGAPAAAHAASFHVDSYTVPVTTPDAFGLPVTIDTDVYLPDTPPPPGGFPLLEVFHGGGSTKDNPYDSGHARRFASDGWVVIAYSARGHGNSTGETAVIGPGEVRDLFDITAWALAVGGRNLPPHRDFHIDRSKIALTGYSQGGIHTNLGQVYAGDPSVDPYGISFRALAPGDTAELVFRALVPNGVVKLSFGLALLETYMSGTGAKVAPVVDKWIATAVADQPQLYGSGDLCDSQVHDAPGSTMEQDLAWRSAGCHPERLGLPWLWTQAFDDTLFPADMAISMWRRAPDRAQHRLYLAMGGHAAPAAAQSVEADKLDAQVAFLDAAVAGRALPGPNVVYWTRDPRVAVPSSAYAYPDGAWYRQTAASWPPAGVRGATYRLGADGTATQGRAAGGSERLAPLAEDAAHDQVGQAALASTPLGTSPASAVPATDAPGFVAAFRTAPFSAARELSGSPSASVQWTPAAPDSQLVLELFDESPSGQLTLFSRAVAGVRGAVPGSAKRVRLDADTSSIRIPAGHRVLAWVMSGNPTFYKPYPTSAGGTLATGNGALLTLPLRARPASEARRRHHRRRAAHRSHRPR